MFIQRVSHSPRQSARLRCALLIAAMAVGQAALTPSAAAQLPCGYDYDIIYGPSCGSEGPALTNVRGISEQGDLVGGYACSGASDRAWVGWDAAGFTALTGMPPGTTASWADDCQNGVIVGDVFPDGHFAFRWENGVGVSLGTLPGMYFSEGYAINASGVIVGSCGGETLKAYRWENGLMQDISVDLPLPFSRALDIADNGAITGWMSTPSAPFIVHPFIWHEGKVTDLGLMPGSFKSEGWAINNRNQVAGVGYFTANVFGGFVRRGFLWDNGVYTDLGVLPGHHSTMPRGINDHGIIVGIASNTSEDEGFVWSAGVLRRIEDFLPPDLFGTCRDVNARGEIGVWGGQLLPNTVVVHIGMRLRPIPRRPGDTNCDGVVNVTDLLAVIAHWHQSGVEADVDGSGFVDGSDIITVIRNWG